MFNRYFTIALLAFYIYLCGFTNVTGDAGQGISGRVIYADIYMLFLVGISLFAAPRILFMQNFVYYTAFLGVMTASLLFSQNPEAGGIELLVHIYNFVGMIALFNIMMNTRDLNLSDIVLCYLYAVGAVAILSILQFYIFTDWFGGRQVGGLVGTFRNTGQAGTFFGMGLAIFLPAIFAGVIRRSPLNMGTIVIILLALILTVKRASLLGFGIGLVGLILLLAASSRGKDRKRNFVFVLVTLAGLSLVGSIIDSSSENVIGLDNRFERKIENFTVEEFNDKFFGSNVGSAMQAFEDSPIFGAGPGNIIGNYTAKYEIHSTPFSILASTGIVGITVYLAFLLNWLFSIWRRSSRGLIEEKFLLYFLPFAAGLIISWGYTYHIRKREFWVLYVIIAFTIYMLRAYRREGLKNIPTNAASE